MAGEGRFAVTPGSALSTYQGLDEECHNASVNGLENMTITDRREATEEAGEMTLEKPSAVRTTSLVILAIVATAFAFYFGREFFVPIVFAILLNALFKPVVGWIGRLRLPTPIAAAVVVLALMAAFVGAGVALAGAVGRWVEGGAGGLGAGGEKLGKVRTTGPEGESRHSK